MVNITNYQLIHIMKQKVHLKVENVQNVKKTRVGDYRIIYFINESTKEVEIIDIGPRRSIYKKWD